MSGNSWIVLGIIATAFAAWALPYGFHLKSKSKTTTRIEDIKVEQKGNTLLNVVGADISNFAIDVEMGKVNVNQEGKNLENVTGVKVNLDSNSSESKLKDKMEIKQNKISMTINADQPGVDIRFNKKTNDDGNKQ